MKHPIAQNELREIESQLSMIAHYERVTSALRVQWKEMLNKIYDRLEIQNQDRELVQIDLANGLLIIEEKKETKKEDISRKP